MPVSVNITGKSSKKSIDLTDTNFGQDFNEALVHQVVTAYLNGARAGTHAQKTRSEVSGGGAKPWRQKGTGRARAGSSRSPLWRKGGVIFAKQPRDYSQKVNRKMYRSAIRSILSELIRQDRLVAVEQMKLDAPKTKALAQQLNEYNATDVLIVFDTLDSNVVLAARNMPNVSVTDVMNVDPVSLINHDKVIFTLAALEKIEERLQ